MGLWRGTALRPPGIVVDIEFDYTESVQFVKYHNYMDAFITIGGFMAFLWWMLYLLSPLIALLFLLKLAGMIHQK